MQDMQKFTVKFTKPFYGDKFAGNLSSQDCRS